MLGDMMLEAKINFERAGYLFMSSAWVQSVMVDLTLLKENPNSVQVFCKDGKFPGELSKQRVELWKLPFGSVKKRFFIAFYRSVSEEERRVFEGIQTLRNILAHSRVSIGKGYLLHAPQDENRFRRVEKTTSIKPRQGTDYLLKVIKIELARDDIFTSWENVLTNVSEKILPRLSAEIDVEFSKLI